MSYEAEITAVPVPFRVEYRHEFEGGFAEIRRYFWSTPLEQTILALSDSLVINMALTSRPEHTQVNRVAPDVGPLAVDAGRLLVMIPGMPYRLAAPVGNLRCLHCALDCKRLEVIAGESIDWASLGSFGGEIQARQSLETHLLRIHEELMHNAMGSGIMIQACIDTISVQLLRRFRQGHPSRPDIHRGGLASWRMKRILDRIHAQGPAPRVTELAELCGLTERQLSRAFKAETGVTIGRFVDDVTMERAHRLLTTTRQPIAEIAEALGFASADSFAQSFRRISGTSPASLRRR